MISYVDSYMQDVNAPVDNNASDDNKILINAMSKILPIIMKNELTEQQSKCMKMFYTDKMTQREIANTLHLSQPTVSRHLSVGRDVTNKFLRYCFISVKQANKQWQEVS